MRALVVLLAALAFAPTAFAGGPSMRIGVAEDAVKRASLVETKSQLDLLKFAGLDAVRVTETWTPGTTALTPTDATQLSNITSGSALAGLKVYVSVAQFGSKTTPLTEQDQSDFAAYAANIASHYPQLAGLIVGNEPNLNRFWLPQFNDDGSDAAAPAYESLLAQTYDVVKAAQPSLQVIGGAVSPRGGDASSFGGIRPTHSPTAFIQDMGIAYRASERTAPIMDAFGFHPYGDNSSQAPSFQHPNTTTIGLADYGKLVALLGTAFDGTGQSGSTLPILYDEYGVESQIPTAKASLYTGTENVATHPVDETTQGTYYAQALALAFCQPNVEGVLLFHAFDDTDLQQWQSGVYYADETPKPSLPILRAAATQSRHGVIVHCDGLALTPKLTYLLWPRVAQLRQGVVRVLFTCDIDCTYTATVGTRRLTGTGTGGVRKTLAFAGHVRKGTYSLRLTLTAPVNPGPPAHSVKVVKVP
jgi:hypothetical protein